MNLLNNTQSKLYLEIDSKLKEAKMSTLSLDKKNISTKLLNRRDSLKSSPMFLDLESRVDNLSPKINPLSVLSEAIVNSIQANASIIDITFYSQEAAQKDFEKTPLILQGFKIVDNGEGFIRKNIDSFCIYGSRLKKKLGCKGIGRVCFLKVFNTVSVRSLLQEENLEVSFSFTDKFTTNDIHQKESGTQLLHNSTEIEFLDIKTRYTYDIYALKEQIYHHVFPLLYLLKETRPIKINFIDAQHPSGTLFISSDDLPPMETHEFDIRGTSTENLITYKFTLHAAFLKSSSPKGLLSDYYCANSRAVCHFKDKDLKITPLPDQQIILLLTSPYFDEKINDERNDFYIMDKKKDWVSPLSWQMINDHLRKLLQSLFYEKFPELEAKNKEILDSIREENLHLIEYIKDVDTFSGIVQPKEALKKAEDLFAQDKAEFKEQLKSKSADSEELIKKASSIAGKELIEYVLTRDKILSQLEKFNENGEKVEKLIHNLIMKKGADSNGLSSISPDDNNIRLIDDKFMSYSYAASDKTIKKISTNIKSSSASLLKPDISIFFRNEKNNHNAVIVEIKSFGGRGHDKFSGVEQLREYARDFKIQENLDSIWYYLITKIDDEFEEKLIGNNFNLLFSNKEKTYFKYYDRMPMYLYVMSSDTLIADARARNKAFTNIVRKMNGLPVKEEASIVSKAA